MQFNDTTTNLGICQEIDFLCDSDSTSYPLVDKTRQVNVALETMVSKIITVAKNFPFDDENYTDISSGTISLTASTSKYTISDKFLYILEMKVKDTEGVWHIVKPTTQLEEDEIMETLEASTGLPSKYRIFGRTIKLSPAPTSSFCTLTDGLKFVYARSPKHFTATDTTAVPGIAEPWHITLCKMAALPYCKIYKKDRVAQLERDITVEIQECLNFYANRQQDRLSRITVRQENNK